jgi:hypothetical protein
MIINKFVLLGLLIGLVIIVLIYLYTYEIILEKFEEDTVDTDDAVVDIADNVDNVDIVDIVDNVDNVDIAEGTENMDDPNFLTDRFIYLTTDIRPSSGQRDYISLELSRWLNFDYNYKNSYSYFTFVGIPQIEALASIPIVNGLNMNNVILKGPNASTLSIDNVLKEFTLLFNFNMSMIDFDFDRLSIFEMSASSSITGDVLGGKALCLQIEQIDETDISLDILFGSETFSETIAIATLKSGITFIALSYKDNTLHLSVNDDIRQEFTLTNNEKLNLSNSPIVINKDGMNAVFYNIAIYKRKLLSDQIEKLQTHFKNHVTGLLSQTRILDLMTLQNTKLLKNTKLPNSCKIINSDLIKISPIIFKGAKIYKHI